MNGFAILLAIASFGQVDSINEINSQAKYGWEIEKDGKLAFIIQIPPGEVVPMQRDASEIAQDIPDFLLGKVERVVFKIGSGDLPHLPPVEILKREYERRRASAPNAPLSAPALSKLDNPGIGSLKSIDRSSSVTAPSAILNTGSGTDLAQNTTSFANFEATRNRDDPRQNNNRGGAELAIPSSQNANPSLQYPISGSTGLNSPGYGSFSTSNSMQNPNPNSLSPSSPFPNQTSQLGQPAYTNPGQSNSYANQSLAQEPNRAGLPPLSNNNYNPNDYIGQNNSGNGTSSIGTMTGFERSRPLSNPQQFDNRGSTPNAQPYYSGIGNGYDGYNNNANNNNFNARSQSGSNRWDGPTSNGYPSNYSDPNSLANGNRNFFSNPQANNFQGPYSPEYYALLAQNNSNPPSLPLNSPLASNPVGPVSLPTTLSGLGNSEYVPHNRRSNNSELAYSSDDPSTVTRERMLPIFFLLSFVINLYLAVLIYKLVGRYRALLSSVRNGSAANYSQATI